MVTNFTANQIGDQIFARLQEPYLDTVRVLSWSILAGVSSPNTVGTLQITQGNSDVVGTRKGSRRCKPSIKVCTMSFA